MAPPSDDCLVPVYGEPLPCGAEYDRQTAPQVTPRLRTPATVAKAQHKQRRSKRVPAVLDLINQLLLCALTCPASKLQRHSVVALRGAKIQLVPASFSQHRLRTAHAAAIAVKPAFVMTQGYWCRGCATSRQPTPSLVFDQLQAASVHACCLHNHHGHAPAFVHYRHRGRDESALPPVMSFACSLLVTLTWERAVKPDGHLVVTHAPPCFRVAGIELASV